MIGFPDGKYIFTGTIFVIGITSVLPSISQNWLTLRMAQSNADSFSLQATDGIRSPFHFFFSDLQRTQRFPRRIKPPISRAQSSILIFIALSLSLVAPPFSSSSFSSICNFDVTSILICFPIFVFGSNIICTSEKNIICPNSSYFSISYSGTTIISVFFMSASLFFISTSFFLLFATLSCGISI